MSESDMSRWIESIERVPEYRYDVIIVLGGGLRKQGGKYHPTAYRNSDKFGMLGGGMRVLAAIDLYLSGQSRNFMFSGVTDKKKYNFEENVPSESQVYKEKFKRILGSLKKNEKYNKTLEDPEFVEENKSDTTKSNIQEILHAIKENKWKNVAIVSSDYHIPRVRALFESFDDPICKESNITFLSAEEVLKSVEPGKYDMLIDKYYRSKEANMRKNNEKKGLRHIKAGEYLD